MANQPWFKKGRIGRGLEGFKSSPERIALPFKVISQAYNGHTSWYLADSQGYKLVQMTLRGNSKQRRQQARAIERYLNEA